MELPTHNSSGFFKKFKITNKKNTHGAIVDDHNDMIYGESETKFSKAVYIRNLKIKSDLFVYYEVDSPIKYSMIYAKKDRALCKESLVWLATIST